MIFSFLQLLGEEKGRTFIKSIKGDELGILDVPKSAPVDILNEEQKMDRLAASEAALETKEEEEECEETVLLKEKSFEEEPINEAVKLKETSDHQEKITSLVTLNKGVINSTQLSVVCSADKATVLTTEISLPSPSVSKVRTVISQPKPL